MIVVGPAPADRVEIVGVSADAKYTQVRAATPATIYFPALQRVDGNANFAVRVSGVDGAAMTSAFAAVRSAVREIDPALPVLNLRTQDEQIDRLHAQELLFARLSAIFGVLAVLLAAIGLYGLMSHAVARRTGEIGLRMALGAQPIQVLTMIVRESLRLVGLGIAVGAVTAYDAVRLVSDDDVWNVAGRSRDLRRGLRRAVGCRDAGGDRSGPSREPYRPDCRAHVRASDGIEERVVRTLPSMPMLFRRYLRRPPPPREAPPARTPPAR